MMLPARLWVWTFAACYAIVGILLCVTLATTPTYGDLTRLGRLSERSFGWRASQPAIDPNLLRSWPLSQADIVVLGDSFSLAFKRQQVPVQLVWQSQLVKAGYRVTTLHWAETGPLCEDLPRWLVAQGFRGKIVLIESAERDLDGHVNKAAGCAMTTTKLQTSSYTRPPPPAFPPPATMNWGQSITTGVMTRWNTTRVEQSATDVVLSQSGSTDAVRVHQLERGCDFFSHAACTKALFFDGDTQSRALNVETVGRIRDITKRYPTLQVAWIVMPNKTSIYRLPHQFDDAARMLDATGIGPNLFKALAAERLQQVDLYAPNDTHLSARGSLFVGQQVVDWLARRNTSAPGAYRTWEASAAK